MPSGRRRLSLTPGGKVKSSCLPEHELFYLHVKVDLSKVEALLASQGMVELKHTDRNKWQQIVGTCMVARSQCGYVPVRYYMHESQADLGRMKSRVDATGLAVVPYVRMGREARAVLAGDLYWDVDMANCQPSFLSQKCRQYKIESPLLDRYVHDREAALDEVMRACGVGREDAKNLFIRLMYLGSVDAWAAAGGRTLDPAIVPAWIHALKKELREVATRLMDLPISEVEVIDQMVKSRSACTPVSVGYELSKGGDPLATFIALFLQSIESECVWALVHEVHGHHYSVGGIIYDGILVDKGGCMSIPDAALLGVWEDGVTRRTGYSIKLAVKPLSPSARWTFPPPPDDDASGSADDAGWMNGAELLGYDEVKRNWERSVFKIINQVVYVRIDGAGLRHVMSERQLQEAFCHLGYVDVALRDSGSVSVSPTQPFISRWIKDPTIRKYHDMKLVPPPLDVGGNVYNIWNGFEVAREVSSHLTAASPAAADDDLADHPSVAVFIDFFHTLCGNNQECTDYLLNWIAQIFQQPAQKTGVAILLKGEEGVGKNRATDLLRAMVGADKFLQTATPGNTLYGRFNRHREGRFLIVVNESNGRDNFAANDVIKDMITCDQFECESKGVNAYTMQCFSRFTFTTNNDNFLRVNPDNRRYVIIETSSPLKCNTAYFNHLSALIDDAASRVAFYKFLMARDIKDVEWIRSRPTTAYMAQMVTMNLPYEYQFLVHLIQDLSVEHRVQDRGIVMDSPPPSVSLKLDVLFDQFNAWLPTIRASQKHETTLIKFGLKMSKLVRDETKNLGLRGVSKHRCNKGAVYSFCITDVINDMREKMWFVLDERASECVSEQASA
eukprot:gene17241-biopygen26135